jgi:hypothetical protein
VRVNFAGLMLREPKLRYEKDKEASEEEVEEGG